MMVIMIVILGTWRCDRWSRSIYSMLTVTCTDHIIIQWWKSKWQGPAPLSCGIGDSSCWMNPHHNMTQTNQDVLLMSNSPHHNITHTNRIKMLCWYMLNSPSHIGTQGQTLGVKQPDSAPGGLLIKRLLKNRYLEKSVKVTNCPSLILAMQGW